jgi:hypothetical protein
MSNDNSMQPEKKPSLVWTMIKSVTLALFPGIRLLRINKGLKRVSTFYKHEWFAKQRRRNLVVSLLVSLPIILTSMFSLLVALKAKFFWANLGRSQSALMKMEIGRAFDYLGLAFSNTDSSERLHIIFMLLGVGIVVSFILGMIVMMTHPLIKESKKLYAMLQRNGVIDKNDKHRLVLATPLGFLIDITGNTAKELKDNERIWMALNLRVTDWSEDPHQRAICFFKKAYELKPSYMYTFSGQKK